MSEHTPTPWFAASAYSSVCGVPIVSQKGGRVGNTALPDMPKEWDELKKRAVADAAFICEAVNNHARLTEQVEAGAAEIARLTAALARAREALFSPEESDASENLDGTLEALTALVEHGITSDVQQLLVLGSKAQGVPPGALSKAVKAALLAAQSAAPVGEPVAFINARLADLAEANAIYGKDTRLGAPDKIARNDREISWLKDLRALLATPAPIAPQVREKIEAIIQRANESGGGTMGLIDTIHAMHGLAREALAALPANPGNTEP